VTLFAFASGAPDLFTQIAAVAVGGNVDQELAIRWVGSVGVCVGGFCGCLCGWLFVWVGARMQGMAGCRAVGGWVVGGADRSVPAQLPTACLPACLPACWAA
jgi:hypothetical protein